MPELPEVETVRRGLAPVMEGQRFARITLNRPDLRFPFPDAFAARMEGARLVRLGRRAKFLVGELDTGEVWHAHLGMTGRFTVQGSDTANYVHENPLDAKHDHAVFEMEDGTRVTFNDPRRFGFMELHAAGAPTRVDDLGPEPLGNGFSGPALREATRKKKTKIKSALLDQRVVAGLGNIYVCEALFRAGVRPTRGSHRLSVAETHALAGHIKDVLGEAIEAGGSSLRDFANTEGDLGYFQHSFDVYGREGEDCRVCGAPVKRVVQAGRSSFFCSECQT